MDITIIFQAIIALVSAVVTAFLIPWLRSKIGAAGLVELEKWVKIAVEAAEQLYIGQGRGAEKKAYVLKFLREKGLLVDTAVIAESVEAMIEAMVYEINKDNLSTIVEEIIAENVGEMVSENQK